MEINGIRNCLKLYKTFKDSVHGDIFVSYVANQIIKNPIFQRLRSIKQLGTAFYVFQNANHTRFEHSIGTYYITGKLLNNLRRNSKIEEIDNSLREVYSYYDYDIGYKNLENEKIYLTNFLIELVKIAGLCHDLGHGPFSHVFDEKVKKIVNEDSKYTIHEKRSCYLIEYIIKNDNELNKIFNDKHIEFIKDLILPNDSQIGFIYQIVNNKLNNMDVDKFDYIYRDSYVLNVQMSFNFKSLVENAKVINNNICYPETSITDIHSLFLTRHSFYRYVYCIPRIKAFDIIMEDVFDELSNKVVNIKNIIEDFENNIKGFANLTDDLILGYPHLMNFFEDNNDSLTKMIKKLEARDCPDFLGQINTKKDININKLKKFIKGNDNDIDKCIIKKIKVGYVGGDNPNPLDNIKIFEIKNNKDGETTTIYKKLEKNKITLLIPENHQEFLYMFFIKDPEKIENITEFRDLIKNLDNFIN
jgi:HD superfamily phosphohydrolase